MIKYIKATYDINNVDKLRFGGKDLRDFKAMVETVMHQYHKHLPHSQRGNWEMGTGGYDEWYWIRYCGVQICSCIAGDVEIDYSGNDYESAMAIRQYAQLFAKMCDYGYDYITAYSVVENLEFGDEVDLLLTDDGYEVYSWMDEVSFGSAFEPKECMFIQVDEGSINGKEVAYTGDIESEDEFEIEKARLLKELSNK